MDSNNKQIKLGFPTNVQRSLSSRVHTELVERARGDNPDMSHSTQFHTQPTSIPNDQTSSAYFSFQPRKSTTSSVVTQFKFHKPSPMNCNPSASISSNPPISDNTAMDLSSKSSNHSKTESSHVNMVEMLNGASPAADSPLHNTVSVVLPSGQSRFRLGTCSLSQFKLPAIQKRTQPNISDLAVSMTTQSSNTIHNASADLSVSTPSTLKTGQSAEMDLLCTSSTMFKAPKEVVINPNPPVDHIAASTALEAVPHRQDTQSLNLSKSNPTLVTDTPSDPSFKSQFSLSSLHNPLTIFQKPGSNSTCLSKKQTLDMVEQRHASLGILSQTNGFKGVTNIANRAYNLGPSNGDYLADSKKDSSQIIFLVQNIQQHSLALEREISIANISRDQAIQAATEQRETISQLSNEIGAVCSAYEYQKKLIQFSIQRLSKMEESMKLYQTAIRKLNEKGKSLFGQVHDLQEKLQLKETETKLLVEEKNKFATEMDAQRLSEQQTIETLQSSVKTLSSCCKDLTVEISEAKACQTAINNEYSLSKSQLNESIANLSDKLKETQIQLDQSLNDLASCKEISSTSLKTLQDQLNSLSAEHTLVTEQLDHLKSIAANSQLQCENLEKELTDSKKTIERKQQESDTTLNTWMATKMEIGLDLENTRLKLEHANSENNRLRSNQEKWLQTIADLKQSNDKNSDLDNQLLASRLENDTTTQRLQQLQSEHKDAIRKNNETCLKMEKVVLAAEQNLTETLKSTKSKFDAEIKTLHDQMDLDKSSITRQFTEQIQLLEVERDALKDKLLECKNSIEEKILVKNQTDKELESRINSIEEKEKKIDKLQVQFDILTKERLELEAKHFEDIEHKTTQWNLVAKRKEMDMQNALLQRDNQIANLKVMLKTATQKSDCSSLKKIETSKSLETTDDIIGQLDLDVLLKSIDSERSSKCMLHTKPTTSSLNSNKIFLKPCKKFCSSSRVQTGNEKDQSKDNSSIVPIATKRQRSNLVPNEKESKDPMCASKTMKPPTMAYKLARQSTPRNTSSVSIIRETTTVHRKKKYSTSKEAVGSDRVLMINKRRPSMGASNKLNEHDESIGRRQLALVSKPDESVTSDATDLFGHTWEES
ncbi:hypothetical protein MT418_006850 [Batrachochytrium dendrobatidis]